jgi:hypothetical protein
VTGARVERAARRLATLLIGRACRSLPGDVRDERYREWVAELPAIVHDPDIGSALRRAARTLGYAAGTYRSARHLRRAAGGASQVRASGGASVGWASRSKRRGLAMPGLPDGVRPAMAALLIYLSMAVFLLTYPPSRSWGPLVLATSAAAVVLWIVAIVRFVRWVRRRSRGTPGSPPGRP